MNQSFILGCGAGLSIALTVSLVASLFISFIPWKYFIPFISIIISILGYYRAKIKSYFASLILKAMISIMFQKEDDAKESNLTIDKNLAVINYSHNDKEYTLRFPYDPIAAKTRSKRVFAITENGQEINITQQPGLPYLITCQHLNAVRIEVRGRDQTVLKTYQDDETIVL